MGKLIYVANFHELTRLRRELMTKARNAATRIKLLEESCIIGKNDEADLKYLAEQLVYANENREELNAAYRKRGLPLRVEFSEPLLGNFS